MDDFTEKILARARSRQKMLENYSDKNEFNTLREINTDSSVSQPNLCKTQKFDRKEIVSEPSIINPKISNFDPAFKENLSEGNLPKFTRQNSKTRISSEIPGSPQSQLKTLNIQRDNFNMEIKVTSADNVHLQVEIEEHSDNDSDTGSTVSENGLRDHAKKRLDRLGKLYAGGDEAEISSPIHRSEEKFFKANEDKCVEERQEITKSKKGLRRLADLAETINQWEDDINTKTCKMNSKSSTPKKTWKPPAPQPPISNKSSPIKASTKSRAPDPPIAKSPVKKEVGSTSPTKEFVTKIVDTTPKQLKWDQDVLDTLESQGFTRSTSKARLVYSYNSQDKKEPTISSVDEEEQIDEQKSKLPISISSPIPSKTTCPKSPIKSHALATGIAQKASLFESSPSRTNAKDPALLSVSERKALFEKNKGAALIPKAPFAMSAPVKPEAPKATASEKNIQKQGKPPAPKPPQQTTAAVSQAGGIASKMAALLKNKSTISQVQIETNIREERQKEMDMLLNRFIKNKPVPEKTLVAEDESDDENDATETTAMIMENKSKIIPSAPPMPPTLSNGGVEKRKSGGKRCSNTDSPKVAAVLDDVKRIKVSPPKAGKLYPNLSDIEATATETETDHLTPSPNNSSFESDDANTSFGREILQAVCKNQTPHKRAIYDESTASDISSILDDIDDYSDDALPSSNKDSPGPTPPKHGRHSPPCSVAQPSHSFNYKSFESSKSEFKSPIKIVLPDRQSSETYVVEGDNVLPLTHTVSFYRKQQTEASKTPVRQISRQPIVEEVHPTVSEDHQAVQNKLQELKEEVNKQQMIISQTSQALNLCNSTPEFSGSTEQVEAEKVLLVATHRRQAALNELQRLKVERTLRPQTEHAQNLPLEKGTLTISKIILPMKQKYVTALAAAGGKGHHVVCLIKCGEQVVPTKLTSTVASSSKNPDIDLNIPGTIVLNDIYSDFTVRFEVYCLQAQEEYLPHEVKYHINSKKSNNKSTPQKNKQESRLVMPLKESPGGPQAVRSPSFALMGYVIFSVQAVNKRVWSLNNTPAMSPLEGSVEMKISCELAVSVEHRGFLTMFEDVSGFGAWHRRWCLLKGSTLSYWKYPDDERKTAPIDSIDLKNCITKQVGPVSRDICARLHTFLLERERMAYPQDKDTLVTVCKGDVTVIRHLLSADTKDERIEWCNKFNAALTALRMWGK